MDLTGAVLRALEAADVTAPPEPLVALLRNHISTSAISHHIAQHTKARVQERAPDGEKFAALHEELRSRGAKDLDRITMFLSRVAEEKAIVQMLRIGTGSSSGSSGSRPATAPAAIGKVETSVGPQATTAAPTVVRIAAPPALGAWQSGWLLDRPYLSSGYLDAGVREQLAGSHGGVAGGATAPSSSSLAALPVAQQEQALVVDILRVLVGVEGVHIRAATTGEDAGARPATSTHPPRVCFVLPAPAAAATASVKGQCSVTLKFFTRVQHEMI
jgi:hypothetical protein